MSTSPLQAYIPRGRRIAAWIALGIIAFSGLMLGLPGELPADPAAVAPVNEVAHWTDAAHDWLIVADHQAGQLAVYDAADGHPLTTLAMARVDAIAEHEGRLYARAGDEVRVLSLPSLTPVR
jgi:hypothetical protein